MSVRAHRRVGTLVWTGRVRTVPDPPQITVTKAVYFNRTGADDFGQWSSDAGAAAHPFSRNDLAVAPLPLPKHKKSQTRHVAGRKHHVIRGILRARQVSALLLPRAVEVLHSDRDREIITQGVEDVFASHPLKGRAGRVEIPVVVPPVGARLLAAAFRLLGQVVSRGNRVRDAGACGGP